MLDFRLNTKRLERPSVIKGVRHFDNRRDAILYASIKYGVEIKYESEPACDYAIYCGSRWDYDMQKKIYISTPAGEWQNDHDVLEVRQQWTDKEGYWHNNLIEFVTYADAYCYEYMHNREYDFIETV